MSKNELARLDAVLQPGWLIDEVRSTSFALEFSIFCKTLTAEEKQNIMWFIKERRAAMANQI